MALAQQALLLVGLARQDMAAALEAVLISREQDRQVFRELFAAYFRNPMWRRSCWRRCCPPPLKNPKAPPPPARGRCAGAALRAGTAAARQHARAKIEFDAAMTASDQQRLRRADFNQLSAGEYQLVQRLVREVVFALPRYASRRTCPGSRGSRPTGPPPCAVQPARAARCWSCHAWRGATSPCPAGAGGCVGINGALCTPAAHLLARRHSAGAWGGRAWGDGICSRLARASRI